MDIGFEDADASTGDVDGMPHGPYDVSRHATIPARNGFKHGHEPAHGTLSSVYATKLSMPNPEHMGPRFPMPAPFPLPQVHMPDPRILVLTRQIMRRSFFSIKISLACQVLSIRINNMLVCTRDSVRYHRIKQCHSLVPTSRVQAKIKAS